MASSQPRLLEARSASARMDALCEFIEFWLGPRQASHGESAERLRGYTLPVPLKRLHEFAGRWPHQKYSEQPEYVVPALSHQDCLVALHRLSYGDDGKLVFLNENQGVWDCRTLPDGEDPPVWCHGEMFDERGGDFQGEKLVCESLSRFLTTFVLQELTLGSRHCLTDEGLSARFASERDAAVPVWIDGPYVHGAVQNYYLWRGVLVARLWGDDEPFLAANHDEGVEFLMENQGPINMIRLLIYRPWSLDIRSDGSARLRYLNWQLEEGAQALAGTFDFPDLLAVLAAAGADEGRYDRNAMIFFHRKGQSGAVHGKYLHDGGFVTALFRRAMERASGPKDALERFFATEWPL